jgi:hypothetical protein
MEERKSNTDWGFVDFTIKEKYQGDKKAYTFRPSKTLWDDFDAACHYNNVSVPQALQVLMSYFIDKTEAEKKSNINATTLRDMLKEPETKKWKRFDLLSMEDKMAFLELEQKHKRVQKYTSSKNH